MIGRSWQDGAEASAMSLRPPNHRYATLACFLTFSPLHFTLSSSVVPVQPMGTFQLVFAEFRLTEPRPRGGLMARTRATSVSGSSPYGCSGLLLLPPPTGLLVGSCPVTLPTASWWVRHELAKLSAAAPMRC